MKIIIAVISVLSIAVMLNNIEDTAFNKCLETSSYDTCFVNMKGH